MNRVLTIKEASEIFGLSEYAVRTGIKCGKLPACQLGGGSSKYRINYDAFKEALLNLCNQNIRPNPDYNNYEDDNIVDIRTKVRRIQQ